MVFLVWLGQWVVPGCVLLTHWLDEADLRLASLSLSAWTAGLLALSGWLVAFAQRLRRWKRC